MTRRMSRADAQHDGFVSCWGIVHANLCRKTSTDSPTCCLGNDNETHSLSLSLSPLHVCV